MRTLLLGLFALAAVTLPAKAAPPNVVVLLADDLGWADVGFHGSAIETPSIDRIAREGVALDRFYTAPMCTPTRAMLLTGRDPIRFGLAYEQINPWNNAGVPLAEHFMPESFRAAGYQTAMVGKWHLGHALGTYHPNHRGFDYYYGHLNTAIDYWTHTRRRGLDWQRNGESVREEGYVTDLQGADAARVIRERDPSKPLFLYVAFNAPHNPMQAPDALRARHAHIADPPADGSTPGYLRALGPLPAEARARFAQSRITYAAMVASLDAAIGRILDALDAEGMTRETIVLFASDNGGFNIFGGDNAPLRGQKAQTFEGGIRVAAALRWPARLPGGGHSAQVMTAMDVFPTLAAAAGVAPRAVLPLDGEDLSAPLLAGTVQPRTRDRFFVSEVPVPGQVFYAVFSGPWKAVEIERPGGLPTLRMLFRIDEDPYEQHDLAAEHPEVLADLARRLAAWRAQEPDDGLRRTPGPHPGWLPPTDWAAAMLPADRLQRSTRSDFGEDIAANRRLPIDPLVYRTPEEWQALPARGPHGP